MLRALIPLLFSCLFVNNFTFGKDDFIARLQEYKLEKNELKKSQLLLDLATVSENVNFYLIEPEAKRILEKGIKRNNNLEINSAKFVLAIVLLNNGKSEVAKQYLLQSKSFFSRKENINVVAILYNYLGHCDYKSGRFRDANESYGKAKMLWKSLNNTIEANLSNSFIAMSLIQMGQLEKAEKIYNECIENLLPYKKNRTLSNYYSQLGEIYSTRKLSRKAAYFFDKGTEYAYRTGDPGTIARSLNYLAISNFYKGDIEAALNMFNKSLEYRKRSGDIKLVCESYYNIGSVYQEEKKFELAEEYYQLSINEAKKHGLFQDQAEAQLEISNIYKEQKQFNHAFEHLTKYLSIKEKMLNQVKTENEHDNELVELLNQSQILEKANGREIQLNKKLKREKSKLRYILLGSVIFIIGIGFFFNRKG